MKKLENYLDIKPYSDTLPNFDKSFGETIKLWIPMIIFNCACHHAKKGFEGNSTTEVIRNILLLHCYGFSAIQQMRERYREEKSSQSCSKPHISAFRVVEENFIGKNIKEIKISCHPKLKQDLQTLAKASNLSLSTYIRNLLVKYYLGYGFNLYKNNII
ncbi:hypothetical protein [Mesocricetibacter intestinalis]|nr:hypothetical protein [Mesocricetibacter intestinalis]